MNKVSNKTGRCCECGTETTLISKKSPLCNECSEDSLVSTEKYMIAQLLERISISQILDNLYLGNDGASLHKSTLSSKKITHILVCGVELKECFPKDFVYCKFPMDDCAEQDLFAYFKQAFDFIENGDVVFVHCAAGRSRSPAIVIGYLMVKNKWSYEKAFEFVRKKRIVVAPNGGFVKQLKELEKKISGKEIEF